MKRVIGIDAGGSKTLGLLVDESGSVLQRARAGGANPRSVGSERAQASLNDVVKQLLSSTDKFAPLQSADVAAICVGAAGIARESDREFFRSVLESLVRPGTIVLLRNDAQIVLRAGTKIRPAVVVIAGTGSLVYGERSNREGSRAGGYGAIIGDRGSAFAIGIAAVRHAALVLDGVEEESRLSRSVLEAVNARTVLDLIERVHHWPPDVGALASLAPLVGDAAQHGDAAARRIIEHEWHALRSLVETVVRAVRNSSPLPVIISGGAFEAVPDLVEAVRAAAQATGPTSVEKPALDPTHGAALLALDAIAPSGR